MENVQNPNHEERNDELVINIIRGEFTKIGYYVEWKKLLASNYGVPQNRRRVIFIGTPMNEKGFASNPISYPQSTHAPAHKVNQPSLDVGYQNSNRMLVLGYLAR